MSSQPSPEVTEDRTRIRAITSLPEAAGQLSAALAIALTGASVTDARIVLLMKTAAYTPDEVAAAVNKRSG